MGIIIRERNAVHCNISNAIFESVGHKCSSLYWGVTTAATEQRRTSLVR